MRKISAHYIINPGKRPIRNGVLEIADDGTILNLRSGNRIHEEDNLEFYSGVIIPGLVNVHCHLELSHLKNQINQNTGISRFIEQVAEKRSTQTPDNILMQNLLFKMHQTGTQALGDIANTNNSLKAKLESPVEVHTFVEIFGLDPDKSELIWTKGNELLQEFQQAGLSASMTPHAPYSVSLPLWKQFAKQAVNPDYTLSLHNQESKDEHEFIRSHSGALAKRFINMGIAPEHFPGPAKSSPYWYHNLLPDFNKLLLIHNTFTTKEDIELLINQYPEKEIYFGLCPVSNMFIENKLPHKLVENRKGLRLCIGTDSMASNNQLSVWEEIKTLARFFPDISLEELIVMATLNGARALGLEKKIGSFEQGKKPGVILLEGINLEKLRVENKSRSRRII
ncbi:MAG: amidohydrolase family protein [Bacteroidota bacterium]|nr:amidohydrolase family protein [Bacteroidota bacterium]